MYESNKIDLCFQLLLLLNTNKRSTIVIKIMRQLLVILGVLAIVIVQVNSIYFAVSPTPYCFQLNQQPGKIIKFQYEVTGQTSQETSVEINPSDPSKRQIVSGTTNKIDIIGDYVNNVCFTSTDGKYKSVSVDFYTHDKAHLMELAKKSQIYELHTKLIQVGENMKEISKNQHFQEQRQIIHSQIIVGHENTIKYFAIGKLLVIIAVTLGQIYLLKSLLDKSSKGYMPV